MGLTGPEYFPGLHPPLPSRTLPGFHSQGSIRNHIRNVMRQCSGLNSVFLELQNTTLFGNQVFAGGVKLR